ncbi:allantoate amidohydrolase [Microlunatus elymi]|uniref:Allantoate amidohydrolase n=2 Tax=Microlunatus elymi TaxID=2596828 RepID=A0A516Q676_9ACTN|nr:allantoate amidohydrolase [Microlunatus elymi]
MTDQFDRMWSELLPIGRNEHTGGYRRYAWTPEDALLRDWFAAECRSRRLELTEDRLGNQWAWWGDPDGMPGIVSGSHLDSVPDGGAYDGPLGVISALAAVDRLQREGFRPARPIGVVNFADEEGARFGVACAGSRVITGAMSAERALGLTDADGISMAEAMRAAGRAVDIGRDPATLRRIAGFVELHVEQGRGLIDRDAAVAVGTGIWPHGRWRLELPGEANHAGTTRLEDRRDAMLSCAVAVEAARQSAEAHDCVATVGKVRVEPGGVNAIPSRVVCWLDARGPDERNVRAAVAEISRVVNGLGGTVGEESWTATTSFDPGLTGRVRELLGGHVPMLGTGAGHDAGILATAGIPATMLFVCNPTGISHSPREYASPQDCHAGVAALTTVIRGLTG